MPDEVEVTCPYCGEPGSIELTGEEEDETFVQDCGVCCRPWQVHVKRRRDGSAEVSVGAEGE